MKKKLLIAALILSTPFLTLKAQLDPPCTILGAIMCDDFDAYTTGDIIGPLASWWTTWSGTEGGTDDGIISSDYAYSGTNSMLIPEGAANDVLLLLGNQTTGKFHLGWQAYIPTGKTGYFNIQESETPGIAWNLELLFGLSAVGVPSSSGNGVVSIPALGPAFIYPPDAWFPVDNIIDLDNDSIYLYIDDSLVMSTVYTGSIGAVDFYSIDANNHYYIDNVLLIPVYTFYADADGDGFGDATATIEADGVAPSGYVSDSTDCNDANASVFPGATEACNTIDDNCDGNIDEGVLITFYADADGDSYGNDASTTDACTAPTGYVSDNTDCDDTNSAIYPGATEIDNNLDDDCDGDIDEGIEAVMNLIASAIHIYPNPSGGDFTADISSFTTTDKIFIEITNVSGQKIYAEELNSVRGEITIHSGISASGIYQVKITSRNSYYTGTIMVE